jgi:hypothetical protein
MAEITNFPGTSGPSVVENTDELYDEIVEACELQQRLLSRWLRIGGEIERSARQLLPGALAIDLDELVRETTPLAGRR